MVKVLYNLHGVSLVSLGIFLGGGRASTTPLPLNFCGINPDDAEDVSSSLIADEEDRLFSIVPFSRGRLLPIKADDWLVLLVTGLGTACFG